MVPRADIIAADESEPLGEVLRMFQDAGVSRIPVFQETLDDPRGMIHVKDLLKSMIGEHGARSGGEAPSQPPPDLSKVDLPSRSRPPRSAGRCSMCRRRCRR